MPSPKGATRSGLRRRLRRDRCDRRAVVTTASSGGRALGPGSRHGGRGGGLWKAVRRPSRHQGRRPTGRALALPCPPRRPRRAGRRASRWWPPCRREPPAGAPKGSSARRPVPGAVTARARSGDRRCRGAVHAGPGGRRGRAGRGIVPGARHRSRCAAPRGSGRVAGERRRVSGARAVPRGGSLGGAARDRAGGP